MNTKNFTLKCKDFAIKNKDGLLKYRGYALVAIGIIAIVIIALGVYWFTRSKSSSSTRATYPCVN